MAQKSFWERVGRGVRDGWEKAKEVGERIGEHADLKNSIRTSRNRLQQAHEEIGKLVVSHAAAGPAGGAETGTDVPRDTDTVEIDLSEEKVRSLLKTVREETEALAKLEAELETAEQAQADNPETAENAEKPEEPAEEGDRGDSATTG